MPALSIRIPGQAALQEVPNEGQLLQRSTRKAPRFNEARPCIRQQVAQALPRAPRNRPPNRLSPATRTRRSLLLGRAHGGPPERDHMTVLLHPPPLRRREETRVEGDIRNIFPILLNPPRIHPTSIWWTTTVIDLQQPHPLKSLRSPRRIALSRYDVEKPGFQP